MPADQVGVVVELVGAVPTEHDVAHAEAAAQRRAELAFVDVLATQNAIDVRDGQFVEANAGLLEVGLDLFWRVELHAGALPGLSRKWKPLGLVNARRPYFDSVEPRPESRTPFHGSSG